MALNQSQIELQIEALLTETANLELKEARDVFKKKLALIVINAIKSTTLTLPTGSILVQGNAAQQTNLAPITASNILS